VPVRLLLDENLSERLLRSLLDVYPGSTHARLMQLAGAADRSVWKAAQAGDYVLVTRDEDFLQLSVLHGAPPKVVWLNIGNARNAAIAALLRSNVTALDRFVEHEHHSFFALGFETIP